MKHSYALPSVAMGWPRMAAGIASLMLGLSHSVLAQQQAKAAPSYFREDAAAQRRAAASPLAAALSSARALTLDVAGLRAALQTAPAAGRRATAPLLLVLPLPNGANARFRVVEAPLMEPRLAVQFPQLKTYSGAGIDDPTATVQLDLTPAGFHAQILSDAHGTVYIDPATRQDTAHYLSFARSAMPASQLLCGTLGAAAPAKAGGVRRTSGTGLRTYRLAVAATGEYTAFQGGTVAQAQAAIVTTVNRVRGVYEKELAVSLTLINNTQLIYTNAATDPYTNTSSDLAANQTTVDAAVGSANYDIGHLMGTGGGGIAGLGVVCRAGQKARGLTGSPHPVGDAFDIDYVAHEMGHQFGANHTFNADGTGASSCAGNRFAGTAYEPGSGTTIMAYAGICAVANNVQYNSDAYFHVASYEEIQTYLDANSCVTATATGNTPPTVTLPAGGKVLPIGTPFRLTATGSDADGDALSYCWEEYDLGPAGSPTAAQVAGDAVPLFRSFAPTSSSTRYFPQLSYVLAGTAPPLGERLPTVTRPLRFRVTLRDHYTPANTGTGAVGGVTSSAVVALSSTSAAGPFAVTAPNTAVTWAGGSTQTVTWNGMNTRTSAVSCQTVNIRLSTDGGLTYPTLLAAAVPNADGTASASITVPNVASTTARLLVEAADNYFFDVSDANFTITAAPGLAVTGLSPGSGPAGTSVVISGAGFTGATDVHFGGVAASFVVNSDGQITATVPATALTGPVDVTNGATAAGGTFQVTPVITGVNPATGAVGTVVVIAGNSFGGATRVSFNGTEIITFTLDTSTSPNTIAVTVPVGATTGPLLVYTAGGASNGVAFTVPPLALSSLAPAPNAGAVRESANVVATLNSPAGAANAPAAPLKVSSLQAGGRKAGTTTVSGNAITFDPTTDFAAGEVVQVTLTAAATASSGATLAQPYVSQFTVRTRATTGLGAGTNYATGTRPEYVVAGNLDADGRPDLVAVNRTANTTTVLLNTATGFAAGTPLSVGTTPQSATLADLNNDGRLDLLVVCASGTINVLQGNGDGTFTAQSSLTGLGPVQMLAVGDLNGDGNLDLVAPVLYSNVGYAIVGLGNGSFGFAASTYTGLGFAPHAVALGDFNEDGRLDLASANYSTSDGTVSVRFGDGAGSFTGSTELPAVGAYYVVAADLTGDGHLDLAATEPFGSGAPLQVWAGTGSGTFGSPATLHVRGGYAYTLSTGDYDGNGTIDLVAPCSGIGAGAGVDVFSYAGGSFSAATALTGFGNQPRYVALADVNNDQALDFITANSVGANSVSVALATPGAALPLPVELVAFTAVAAGPAAVRLSWATASENNSARFEVERSADGRAFALIGTVAAAGSSTSSRSYELLDGKLPTGAATLYYRLRQVDADGTFSYSPVRTVSLTGAAAGLTLFPNPAYGGAATLTGTAPGTAVTVFDALGRTVTAATADAAGTAALVLPAGLPAGVYVVRAGSTALRLTVE